METTVWDVEIPLPGGDHWLAVARCRSPEVVGEVCSVLAKSLPPGRTQFRVSCFVVKEG